MNIQCPLQPAVAVYQPLVDFVIPADVQFFFSEDAGCFSSNTTSSPSKYRARNLPPLWLSRSAARPPVLYVQSTPGSLTDISQPRLLPLPPISCPARRA